MLDTGIVAVCCENYPKHIDTLCGDAAEVLNGLGTDTRAAPKLMPPILLCWPTTSEANVVDMAVEVEPSRQYSVKFRCRATDGSRGAA